MGRIISGAALGLLVAIGIGLILAGQTLLGIVLASAGLGVWLADFRMEAVAGGRQLVAKGSPALLLLPLMLGAGKVYVATTSSVFAERVDPIVAACALQGERPSQPLLMKLLGPRP